MSISNEDRMSLIEILKGMVAKKSDPLTDIAKDL
jgi:hypothetical protein